MVPFLREADFDGALDAAMQRRSTPPRRRRTPPGCSSVARSTRPLGLVGAPIAFLGSPAGRFFSWRRYGKDPVYLDDPSILMPAPPPDLTAASGAFVMDGGSSRRALTTAMLDLASRGLICVPRGQGPARALEQGRHRDVDRSAGDAVEEAQRARNARRPIGPAEDVRAAQAARRSAATSRAFIEPDNLPKFGTVVSRVRLEARGPRRRTGAGSPRSRARSSPAGPARACSRSSRAVAAIVHRGQRPDVGPGVIGRRRDRRRHRRLSSSRPGMPSVTMPGRWSGRCSPPIGARSQKTMEQARSMQQVVDEAGLDLARDARPGGRVGHGARAAGRDRERPAALASRTSASSRRSPHRPTSRSGTRRRMARSFASGVASGSGG